MHDCTDVKVLTVISVVRDCTDDKTDSDAYEDAKRSVPGVRHAVEINQVISETHKPHACIVNSIQKMQTVESFAGWLKTSEVVTHKFEIQFIG